MAGPDILAGVTVANEGNYNVNESMGGDDEWLTWFDSTFTVTADGTADGMQVRTGTLAGQGAAVDVRMLVADAAGNVLASTPAVTYVADTWLEADFTAPIAVALNDEVQLWFAMGPGPGNYESFFSDGATWQCARDLTGTFAASPDPMNNANGGSIGGEGRFGLRLMGIVGGGGSITGSGAPQAQSAVVAGVGERELTGLGTPASQPATADGAGDRGLIGLGSLLAQASIVNGSGTVTAVLQVLLTAANNRELRDENNALVANLLNIRWEWYDDPNSTAGDPQDSGLFSTDANGEATITISGSALSPGQFGCLVLFHPSDNFTRHQYYLPVS